MFKFKIVIFTDHEEVAVVPANWLDGTSCSLWPPYKNSLKVIKSIQAQEAPSESWKSYPIRHIGEADSYERAKEKLEKAEYTSDVLTDAEVMNNESKKRFRRKPSRFDDIESDSDESICTTTKSRKVLPMSISLPQPPSLISKPLEPPSPKPMPFKNFSPVSSPTNSSLERVALNDILPKIFTTLEEVKFDLKMLARQQAQMVAMNNKSNASDDLPEEMAELIPLQNMADINKVEEFLKSDSNFKAMISRFSMIGGTSYKDATRRTLTEIISNPLSLQFNWMGKGEKRGFSQLLLCQVIIKSVRKLNNNSDKDIEDVIKDWFRGAGDRNGRKRKSLAIG